MRLISFQTVLYTFLFLLMFSGPASGSAGKPPEPPFVPGQILVKFRENVPRDRITELVQEEGGAVRGVIGSTEVYLIVFPENTDIMEAVERFNSRSEVLFAEPNYRALPLEER